MLYTGEIKVSQGGENKASEIEKALRAALNTPVLIEDFERKFAEITRAWRLCEKVEIIYDENPYVEEKTLGEEIWYRKEHHIDTVICDENRYEIDMELETYEIGYTYSDIVIHSAKVNSVIPAKEE